MGSSQLLPTTQAMSSGLAHDLVVEVRRLILSGELPPGERVLPQDLQERFNVSVIPVREALRTLQAEGLVTTTPRRGTVINSLSIEELREVYALRRLIEPNFAARAAQARTIHDVTRAEAAFTAMNAVDGEDLEAWMDAHREFHWSLMDVQLGAVSARTIRQLWAVSERYLAMSLRAFRVDRPARHDHRLLLEAFIAGDARGAATESESHLHLVEQTIIADFDHPSDGPGAA